MDVLRTCPVRAEFSIEERRCEMEVGFTQFQVAADVRCQPVHAGGVPAERVIYYLHGGGYVMGSINTHREMASRLSRAAGARVLRQLKPVCFICRP